MDAKQQDGKKPLHGQLIQFSNRLPRVFSYLERSAPDRALLHFDERVNDRIETDVLAGQRFDNGSQLHSQGKAYLDVLSLNRNSRGDFIGERLQLADILRLPTQARQSVDFRPQLDDLHIQIIQQHRQCRLGVGAV